MPGRFVTSDDQISSWVEDDPYDLDTDPLRQQIVANAGLGDQGVFGPFDLEGPWMPADDAGGTFDDNDPFWSWWSDQDTTAPGAVTYQAPDTTWDPESGAAAVEGNTFTRDDGSTLTFRNGSWVADPSGGVPTALGDLSGGVSGPTTQLPPSALPTTPSLSAQISAGTSPTGAGPITNTTLSGAQQNQTVAPPPSGTQSSGPTTGVQSGGPTTGTQSGGPAANQTPPSGDSSLPNWLLATGLGAAVASALRGSSDSDRETRETTNQYSDRVSGGTSFSGSTGGSASSQQGTNVTGGPEWLTTALQNRVGGLGTPQNVQAYMNPYLDAAMAPTLRQMQERQAQAANQFDASAVGAGAFGTSRADALRGQQAFYDQRALADTTAQMYSNAFNQAVGREQQDFTSAIGAAGQYAPRSTVTSALGTQANTNMAGSTQDAYNSGADTTVKTGTAPKPDTLGQLSGIALQGAQIAAQMNR